jgi:hypothetical protein
VTTQCSAGKWRVGWWVTESQFSSCELLLLDAGSWGTGIVKEARLRGKSAVKATTRQRLVKTVRVVVNYRVCDLAIALWLLVVMIHKCSINPITNPNPVYSHTHTCDNIKVKRALCLITTTWGRAAPWLRLLVSVLPSSFNNKLRKNWRRCKGKWKYSHMHYSPLH